MILAGISSRAFSEREEISKKFFSLRKKISKKFS